MPQDSLPIANWFVPDRFPCVGRGKVRDLYALDDRHLLIVASDRLSAFDVVLPQPIPGKGEVLTRLSNFWFARTQAIMPNHLLDTPPLADFVPDPEARQRLASRAVVARRLRPLPVEAIARGYLIGSAWKDYCRDGSVCGIRLPAGLPLAARLEQPIYTPSTKAAVGAHDQNIDFAESARLLGAELAAQVRDRTLALYTAAAAYAQERGVLIADTKFEFGLDEAGRLLLIDEALTPDSSRFWPATAYRPGENPPSFDKQYVRDYLESIGWDKRPPAPELPETVIAATSERYAEAERRLMSSSL